MGIIVPLVMSRELIFDFNIDDQQWKELLISINKKGLTKNVQTKRMHQVFMRKLENQNWQKILFVGILIAVKREKGIGMGIMHEFSLSIVQMCFVRFSTKVSTCQSMKFTIARLTKGSVMIQLCHVISTMAQKIVLRLLEISQLNVILQYHMSTTMQ